MIEGAQPSPNNRRVFSAAAKLQRATDLSGAHPALIRKEPGTRRKNIYSDDSGGLRSAAFVFFFFATGRERNDKVCVGGNMQN